MKVNAISLDETIYFKIKPEDKRFIKEIRTVYCYDPTVGVHCCEITPSYELIFVHIYIVFTDELYDQKLSDDLRDELDFRYCHEGNDDIYRHCASIKRFAINQPNHHKEIDQEFESMEEAREHLNANWPF